MLVAGTYDRSEAYPNVLGRIAALLNDDRVDVLERFVRISVRGDRLGRSKRFWWSGLVALRLVLSCVRAATTVVRHRDRTVLYVPYPGVFVLFALSLLPRRLLPERIVADAFISVYDTVVEDRKMLDGAGMAAGVLRRVERRAFLAADRVIVDTAENATHYARLLGLDRERLMPLPLATPFAGVDSPSRRSGSGDRFQLLFVGTMVPLHGIDVLCEAVRLLPTDLRIDVRIHGDGQCAGFVRDLEKEFGGSRRGGAGIRVRWNRNWLDTPSLVRVASSADLCVGVLGSTPKAQRVWPFKNYLYMACGRPLLNVWTPAAAAVARLSATPCFVSASCAEAHAVASSIERAVRDPSRLDPVGRAAKDVFDRHLSGTAVDDGLLAILRGLPSA